MAQQATSTHGAGHGHGDSHGNGVQQVVDTHHIIEPYVYYRVFAALMVLFILTVMVAFFDLSHLTGWPPANIIVALIIAVIKATIIVMYFMHVKYSSRLTQLFSVLGLFWLMILFAYAFADYFTRDWIAQPGSWNIPGAG